MKRYDHFWFALLAMVVFLALTGCAPQVATPSPGDIQTALAQTLTAEPSPTLSPTPRSTNTPAASPTPFQTLTPTLSPPVSGEIAAAYLNLRSGPSTFFDIIQTFVEGTQLTALSRTADNRWLNVEIEFEDDPAMQGWMAAAYLEMAGETNGLPVETFEPERTIQGRVADTEGNPIPGINIAVILQYDQVDLRDDTTSGEDGSFAVYLPEDLFGTFDVQVVSWNCESPIADANCQLSGYIQVEDRAFFAVPVEEVEEIVFTYEATNLTLSGSVVEANGDPGTQTLIVAERDDGASSVGRSDALGEFSMPIAPGTWEVYTVTYDPELVEGERLTVEVSDTNPEEIVLEVPNP